MMKEMGFWQKMWFRWLRLVVWFVRFLTLVSYKVYGRENVPAGGPYLIVSNHMGCMDVPLVFMAMPIVPLRLFAGEKWAHIPIANWLLSWSGAIYINRGEADRKAIQEALTAIEEGSVFALAPEGTRSKVHHMLVGRDGAAYLATKANVPIVPVGVVNTDMWSHNVKKLRWTYLEAYVGKPFTLPDLNRRIRSKDLPAYTHFIMVKIAELLPERYHGYYADSPALAALKRGEDAWPYCVEAEEKATAAPETNPAVAANN